MSQIFIKDEHDIGVADIKTEGNAANILGMLIQSVCSVARGIGLSKEKIIDCIDLVYEELEKGASTDGD